jgi:plasmid stability protein
MTLTISLSPETERELEARAAERGQNVEAYVHSLIEQAVSPSAQMGFDELLAPIRSDFEATGMTADELDTLFSGARDAVWEEKQMGNRS